MSAAVRLALAALALALASGCYTVRAGLPGALRHDLDDEQVIVVGRVDREVAHVFFLGGLLGGSTDALLAVPLEEAVAEAEADGVANLRFEARFSPLDVALSSLTLGLVSPRTYRVQADLVRIEAAPLPGRPLPRRALPDSAPPGGAPVRRRPLPEGGPS